MGCYANDVLDNVNEPNSPSTGRERVSIRIYPNPATTFLSIAIDDLYHGRSVRIMDLSGRTIHTVDNVGIDMRIDLSGWKTGMYLAIIGETLAPFQIIR